MTDWTHAEREKKSTQPFAARCLNQKEKQYIVVAKAKHN